MAATNTVEKIEIIGSSRGLDTLEQDLNRVADAQNNVAGATKATETVTEQSTRTVSKLDRALDRQARSLDSAFKAQQDYARGMSLLDQGLARGSINAATHAQRVGLLDQKYSKLAATNDNFFQSLDAASIAYAASLSNVIAQSNLVGGAAKDAASSLADVGQSADESSSWFDQLGISVSGAAARLALFATTVGAAAGTALIASVIQTSSEFQRLEGSLQTVTGSAAAAKQAMAFVKDFAKTTPFDVQQVTEAFIKLKLLGLDPSAEALTSYGNTASAMGKPLMQFIEAIADATTGEFERLKEFGIKAAKDGEKVSLTFQGQTTTIRNSAQEIEGYLRTIGTTKFAGGMEREAAQLGGALSNAQDAVVNFQAAIGEGGLANAVANVARKIGALLDANHDLADDLGGVLGRAITDFLRDVDTMFREARGVSAWADGVAKDVERAAYSFANGATGMYNVWKANADATAAMVPAWVSAWTDGIFKVSSANAGATANMGLSWKGFVSSSIDEIANLAASFKALGGIGSDLGFSGTFKSEYASIREELQKNSDEFLGKTEIQLEQVIVTERMATASRQEQLSAIKESTAGLDTMGQAAANSAAVATPAITAVADASSDAAKKAEKATESYTKQGLAIDGIVADLERQIAMLGQSEGAAAAAEFKARELAKAWETAREAGKDFIPAATLAAIDAASAKIGGLTDKLGALTEANSAVDEFFPFEKASREATRLQGILSDTSLGLSDLQRSAIQMKIDKGFVDAQSAAEGLAGKGTKAAEDIGQAFIQNVGDVFADVFSQATRDGEDFFGSILKSFAGLGSQLAAAGGKNLLGQLFGIKDPKAASAAGIGGLLTGAASAAPSLSSFSSAPKPSSAAQAISDKLAEGLTKSVSSNLLSSILGSGKSSSHISGLNTNFANALTNMLDAAPEAVRSAVTINSGFRSVARQAELFDAALKKYGSVSAARKWVAPPGNSKHNVGMAADLGYASGATKDWIHSNAGKFGLAFPLGNEDWHIELASARGGNTKAIEKGVSQGVQQGLKATAYDQGGYDAGSPKNPSGGTQQLTGAQRGLGAIGAGLGIFGQGYESGSPLSGGVSGALGGFQAAQALGVAGPIGMVAGAALGILGGVLGGRAKRKAAHEEAAKKWEEVRPQYEAFDRSLSGEGVGQLRAQNEELWGQLNSFMQVGGAAWKNGTGNSTAQFNSTGTKMFDKIIDSYNEFRDGFSYMLEDLTGGEGLEGAFAKGRANVKALGEQVKGFIDDVKIAWGSSDNGLPQGGPGEAADKAWQKDREAAVEKAKAAAGAYALTMLYTADTTSDVQKAIDSFRGTAAGLQPILEQLGWTADEAAKAIDERLTQALTKMRGDFEEGITDQVNGLDDKGYFAEVREMIEAFEQTKKDAELLGADTSLLPKLFELQGQAIVDGAELTGEAFDDLIKAFPSLAGVVKAFVEETVKRTAEQLKDLRSGYDDRYFSATNDNTTLAGQLAAADRRIEQERQAEIANGGEAIGELERALTAERLKIISDFAKETASREREAARQSLSVATDRLQSLYDGLSSFSDSVKDFLSNMKIGESSTLSAKDQLAESRRVYEETLAKANGGDADARDKLLGVTQTYLDQAKGYFVTSEAYGKIFDEVQASLKATDVKTTSQLDLMRSSATWLERISENTLTVAQALADYLAAEKALNGARAWGSAGYEDRNKAIVGDLSKAGISYTGDFGGGKFLDWTAAQLPSQQAIINAIVDKYDRQFQLNSYTPKTPGLQLGGLVGAYAEGGIVGNGVWNRDSVLARYAGGGHIGLAGGEFVMPAPRVTPATMPILEGLRAGQMPGNDNAAIAAELRALRADNARLLGLIATTTGNGFRETVSATERGNRSAEQTALAARRGITNKQAAG